VGRGDDVVALERGADARGDRLLSDRDVQEAGELARAEALLDLLLEPADEEHLSEEALEHLLGDAPTPGFGPLLDGRHGPGHYARRTMRAVDQWQLIEQNLPEDWEEATLSFVAEDSRETAAAAAVLGPLGPGRFGNELRLQIPSSGPGGRAALKNLLRRLDRKRIWGTLRLLDAHVAEPAAPTPSAEPAISLAAAWDAALATLPPDWSDLLCELDMDSSDYLPQAALIGAPLNPMRNPDALALQFRVADTKGYGAPAGLVRRCLERMDAEGIRGRLTVLHGLSETENVGTQGPVWRIAGRSV
jgi:hypothetical protein